MREEETFAETLQQQFRQSYKIHWNLEQIVIVTTEDKLRLCLQNAIGNLGTKWGWWTPLALLVTLVLALTTAEFKDQFAISAARWHAIFLILAAISLGWTIVAIYKAVRIKVSVDLIVAEIKHQSPEITDVEAGQRD